MPLNILEKYAAFYIVNMAPTKNLKIPMKKLVFIGICFLAVFEVLYCQKPIGKSPADSNDDLQEILSLSDKDIKKLSFEELLSLSSRLDKAPQVIDQKEFIDAVVNNDIQNIEYFLYEEEDLEINMPDSYGRIALCQAARNGHHEMVAVLLKNNANVNAHNKEGITALMEAASRGYINIVSLLLQQKNINPTIRDNNGRTALDWALKSNRQQIVQLLTQNTAVKHTSAYRQTSLNPILRGRCYGRNQRTKISNPPVGGIRTIKRDQITS